MTQTEKVNCLVNFSENIADNFNRSFLVLNVFEINFILRKEGI